MSSIDRVAELAGVSKATVSRVVNQKGNVHPKTAQAVRAAIERAGYEPPSLKMGRVTGADIHREPDMSLGAYALVVPEIAWFYVSLLGGFEWAAKERYRQSLVCNTYNDVYKQSHELLQLIHKRVAGVAIVPVTSAPTPPAHLQTLKSAGIPVVLLHRDVEGAACPLISRPLDEVGYMAGRAIVDKGHRNVAVLTGTHRGSGIAPHPHHQGVRTALEERGLSLPEEMIHVCDGLVPYVAGEAEASVARSMDTFLSLPPDRRPTAIYATTDALAEIAYMDLIGRGMRVPEDMSIVSLGGRERIGVVARRLTAVVVDEKAVGRVAVELLEHGASDRGAGFAADRIKRKASLSLYEGVTLAPPPPQPPG